MQTLVNIESSILDTFVSYSWRVLKFIVEKNKRVHTIPAIRCPASRFSLSRETGDLQTSGKVMMEKYFEFCLACYKYPDLIGLVELNYVIAGLFAHGTRREFLTLAQT